MCSRSISCNRWSRVWYLNKATCSWKRRAARRTVAYL